MDSTASDREFIRQCRRESRTMRTCTGTCALRVIRWLTNFANNESMTGTVVIDTTARISQVFIVYPFRCLVIEERNRYTSRFRTLIQLIFLLIMACKIPSLDKNRARPSHTM